MHLIRTTHYGVLGVHIATWGDKDEGGEHNLNVYKHHVSISKCERMSTGGYCTWYPWSFSWSPWFKHFGLRHRKSMYDGGMMA